MGDIGPVRREIEVLPAHAPAPVEEPALPVAPEPEKVPA